MLLAKTALFVLALALNHVPTGRTIYRALPGLTLEQCKGIANDLRKVKSKTFKLKSAVCHDQMIMVPVNPPRKQTAPSTTTI